MSRSSTIDPSTAKAWLADGQEVALVDVREAGEFASGHPLFASSIPLGILDVRLLEMVPSRSCRLVLVDDGYSGRAKLAAEIASRLGYSAVFQLDGGTAGWQRLGMTLFEGVFVPSKAFGELVEEAFSVPHISPQLLRSWQDAGKEVVLLDGRPFEEHRRMNIPGSTCLPNGELAYRAHEIVPDPDVPIVVHCAGRTRSIIGAQILRDLGFANPVFALENGTQGWTLAGYELERGSVRRADQAPSAQRIQEMRLQAQSLADAWDIPCVDVRTASVWAHDTSRTTYVLDVRSDDEFLDGHIAGAVHAPGGQLIQSTDQWIGVRRGRIVLVDDTGLRAVVVARWLRMMGLDCHVLSARRDEWSMLTLPARPTIPTPSLPMASLPLPGDALILDTRSSMEYRAAHIAGARWILRWQLGDHVRDVPKSTPIVLCGDASEGVALVASDLRSYGFGNLAVVRGQPADWRLANVEVVATALDPTDAEALDFVFFTHDRHSGNLEAAHRYLSWETGLVDRLGPDERSEFRIRPNAISTAEIDSVRTMTLSRKTTF